MEPQNIGRYVVKSRIGKGGMATIFLAHDPMFGRDVAVKVLPREFLHDPSFRGRFEREARTIAALEHPAIVPVYDFGEDNGQPYLVMRYMRGGSLADRLQKGPLSVTEAAHILDRIGAALDHAHQRGIVHRDLKPGNILFDDYGDSFLADFGIVKISEATATFTGGGIVGTPAYMSPEQVHGDKTIDGRSDIYTLGVILFEMLTGQMPFRADTPAKLMMAHVLDPTPRILEVNPNLPTGCNEVIERAMAKNPDQRFTTASEMSRLLTGYFTRPSMPTDATIREPLPPDVAAGLAASTAAAGTAVRQPTPPPAYRPATQPPVYQPTPPPSGVPAGTPPPAVPTKERPRMLVPAIAGIVILLLCCGLSAVGVWQLGLLPFGGTPTPIAVIDATATTETGPAGETPSAATATPVEQPENTAATEAAATANALATEEAGSADATASARDAAATAQANADSATREAIAAATADAEANTQELIAAANQKVSDAKAAPPAYGPDAGSLVHIEDGFIESIYTGVNVVDFVAEATFYTPYSRLEGSWDFGFMFRESDVNEQLRLAIESNRAWSLGNRSGEDFELIAEGEVDNLETAADSTNTLLLVATGDVGYFFLNGEFIAQLDLSARTTPGDVGVAIGLYEGDEKDGSETRYDGFALWTSEEVAVATPTTAAPPAGATTVPAPPPPPATNVNDDLLASMKSVRRDITNMGGMIDNAVNTGYVNCQNVIDTYVRVRDAPSYSNLSGVAVSAHTDYRSAINTFTNGARDMYQNCVDFIASGGGGSIPFQQWGRARQSVDQALAVLNPAIERLENSM